MRNVPAWPSLKLSRDDATMDSVTADVFLGGAVTVFQPKTGFRAGTDSILLAAALGEDWTGQALEIGCGAGGALLPAAWRCPSLIFTGVECEAPYADLARRGVDHNDCTDRIKIETADGISYAKEHEGRFDVVFSNPPFFDPSGITAPGRGKAAAYLASVPIGDWIAAMLTACRLKGRIVLIHRAAELTPILAALDRRAGEIEIMPVRSYPGADAKRVIVRARKGLRPGPTRLLSGIDLYEKKGGARTEAALAVSARGEGLNWS